jgi:hypothetical protein
VLQQRIALDQQGFNRAQSDSFVQSIDMLRGAYVALGNAAKDGTVEMTQHAIQSGNAEVQQRLLGFSFNHSTDATVEHANQTRALSVVLARSAADQVTHRQGLLRTANAAVAAARESVEALSDQDALRMAGSAAVGSATRDLNKALADQARLTVQVASAIASSTRMQQDATVATRELAAAAATANEEAKRHGQQQMNDAAKERRRAAAAAAPSAQDLRARAEALRLAREANDNALLSAPVERQTAQAREHLAFATRELALAESSRHDHTRRVTSALQAQSQAQAEYNRSLGAEIAAARARVTAEDALFAAQSDLNAAAEASLRTGAEQLRQAEARRLSMLRAREDAVSANAAAMGGGAPGAEDADTAADARAAMATEETSATRELARATQDLAQARREENDASISFEERTTHVTEALARQTTALQRQRTAQAASNAEVQKIRTDRMDFLTNSTKGLADGLVQAGLAAAFAGESVGAALQKQLAASLQALAIEAAQKALFATATGLFQLATGNPAAAASFASAATFAAVAVTAGAIGAAVAPAAAPTTPGAEPGAGRAGDVTPSGAGGRGGGSSAGPIVNNYYAPIVGGRQSTDAETGVRIDRYNDAARARLRRAA